MSAFVFSAVLGVFQGTATSPKRALLQFTGPTSYDTNGSAIDVSSANADLIAADPMAAFVRVDGVSVVAINPHASDKYLPRYVRAASGAPATGTVKVRNALTVTTGTPGSLDEVASTTNLSGTTFTIEVIGA